MLRSSVCRLLAASCLACSIHASVHVEQAAVARGVIVDEVSRDGTAAASGIQPGDVLLGWSRAASPPANPQPAQGGFFSAFDLADVEIEQVPRGAVMVTGTRDRERVSFTLRPGVSGLKVRPQLPEHILPAYARGNSGLLAKDVDGAVAAWREAIAGAQQQKDSRLACWLLLKTGDALRQVRKWPDAQSAYEAALVEARAANDLRAVAFVYGSLGTTFQNQNNLTKAAAAFQEAVAIRERSFPGSLAVALDLNRLGIVASIRGDSDAATDFLRKGLAIRERLAPGSLSVAASLNNLGVEAQIRGDLAAADDYDRRSLAISERLAPGSRDVALALGNIALVSRDRGSLAAAEDYGRRALAIFEKLSPGSLEVALTLNNLGVVAMNRRDLTASEAFHKRALAIREELAPGSLDVSMSLDNLGTVAMDRGDFAAAQDFFTRTLSIREKQVAPGSLTLARPLYNLGDVARRRGDLAAAEDFFTKTLAIREKLAPGSLETAVTLSRLGGIAKARGDLTTATGFFTRALALREKLAPGSVDEAESLHELGNTIRQTGDAAAAGDYFRRAVDAVESQVGRVGGAEDVRSGYAAQFLGYYRDYADLLIEQRQPERAFALLEQSRARSLLAMLAERDLIFSAEVPPDLERERKLADVEYDRTQSRLAGLSPSKDGEEIERLLAKLQDLRFKRVGIGERIRTASPRLAALQYPKPLDVAGVQASLDPGTVLLSYMVAEHTTFLFVIRAARATDANTPGISVLRLPIGDEPLREKVERFRHGIQSAGTVPAGWIEQGRELYRLLIEPASDAVAASERIVISPDGPLHLLPFAALVTSETRDASGHAKPRYWVESKALHVVVSGTLYAELKKTRQQSGAVSLAAFGDPKYPALSGGQAEAVPNPEARSAVRRGYSFAPLPGTRTEVQSIAELFPRQAAVYVGDQATEERVKAIGKDVRYIHFATHGFLDERFPLNSALALTIPESPADGQDNGLLQAWEIFEGLRINADLVVLSACETALGKEMGGEGLVGLTRAFQYAGARSIVASLWSVADESTPELMKRFYSYLKAGQSKDEALRAAQIDLIRGVRDATAPDLETSHPFHWAAFQLIGDWK